MTSWLEKYRNCDVEILYLTDNNMFSDKGRLMDFSDQWLEVIKNAGKHNEETFVVPMSAVRIMKIISRPGTLPNRLLRPVEPPPSLEEPDERRELGTD